MKKAVSNMIEVLDKNPSLKEWFMMFDPSKDEGYMWSRANGLGLLADMVEPYGDGHSGASFSVCCRLAREQLGVLKKEDVFVMNPDNNISHGSNMNLSYSKSS